jgi:quinoprotein glucose dehydrogenase
VRPARLGSLAALALAPQGTSEAPRVAPASEEGRLALAGFQAADGISLELFAAEPLLANPVNFWIDARGDAYVAETFRHHAGVTDIRDHMDWLDEDLAARTVDDRVAMMRAHEGANFEPGYAREEERVRLVRDTDGDGVADLATVFADGFRDPAAGIGAGLLARRGDVYYACIPDLWLLRDADGDGAAESRAKLSTGYGVHVALLGHDLHGLAVGPDRRLYFSCGDRGFQVETERGTLAHPGSGAVLRCELDGTGLEIVHDGLRNPQELAFDDRGDLFTGDNNSDGGDRARWVNVVEGGDSGWRYAFQWITAPVARGPWNDEKLWHPAHAGQAAYIVPPIANLADGPSGLAFYPGTGLGPRWQGHFFLCDFRGDAAVSGIHAFTVVPRGASYELGAVEPFVWKVLVTDCGFGPDGSLYFSDWVHGWEKTGKGRLYRALDARERDAPLVRETRELLGGGLERAALADLVELLGHPDLRVRQEAHFALADRGREGIDALAECARRRGSLASRLHAIWGLWVAGRAEAALALAHLVGLARDPEPEVRAQALHVLGDARFAPAAPALLAGLADAEPRVRFFAALGAGRLGRAMPAGTVDALAREVERTGASDTNLRHALVMGLLGAADDAALERLAGSASASVRLATALVLRRRADARIARFLVDPEPLVVLEAARAIHDLPIEGALSALAALEPPPEAPRALARRVTNARFRLGRARELGALALRADLAERVRIEALEALASWASPAPRDAVVNEWRPLAPRDPAELAPVVDDLLRGGLEAGPDALFPSFARLAVAAGRADTAPLFEAVCRSRERASAARVAALDAAEAFASPDLVPLVRACLADPDGALRAAALEKLERFSADEALPALPPILENGEIAERRVAYRILGAERDPRARALLAGELERLASGYLAAELAFDLARAVEASQDPALAARLAELAAPRAGDPVLAPHMDLLFGGDPGRGREVYQRVELTCWRCHAVEPGEPRGVGPNLAGVSRRLTRLQMLESIVAPNRHTSPGFAATVFFLRDGPTVAGRALERTDEIVRVLLASGEIVELDPAAIEEERADLSAMPEDLTQLLAPADLRDLLAYLGSL